MIKGVKSKPTLDPLKSSRGGLGGVLETLLRRFKTVLHMMLILPLYVVACAVIGLAVAPGIMLVRWVNQETLHVHPFVSAWSSASAVVAAIFLSGFCLVFVLPFANVVLLLGGRLQAWRGPYYSLEAIRWYIHNGITYVLRYTLLEFFTPSPIAVLFYKLMGMKIGSGSVINSTSLSDPSLITIGSKVTIGGSVTIVGHYGQAGFLVLAPVEIGDGSTIGLRVSIMGGVRIGKNARVMAHSVVLPKTEIGDGESWGGVPAVRLDGPKENVIADVQPLAKAQGRSEA
jgi:hypothetical protein